MTTFTGTIAQMSTTITGTNNEGQTWRFREVFIRGTRENAGEWVVCRVVNDDIDMLDGKIACLPFNSNGCPAVEFEFTLKLNTSTCMKEGAAHRFPRIRLMDLESVEKFNW